MRTTLNLADDIYWAAKTLAEESGKTLSEIISELVRKALKPSPEQNFREGLPTFGISPNAEIIPGARVTELLAEEDIE